MDNSEIKKIGLVGIALIIIIAVAATFYFAGEFESNNQITDSTNIEIYFKQYGGFVPIDQAELELFISNDGDIRVIRNNIYGFPVKGYSGELTRTQLVDLTNLLIENRYIDLDEKYTTPEGVLVSDVGIAEITIEIDSEIKNIVIDPNVNDYLPENLKNIVNELRTIVDRTIEEGNIIAIVDNNILFVWQKHGGIAGINEELTITSVGTLSFTSNLQNDNQGQITFIELNNLVDLVDETEIFSVNNKSYTAKNGVADFFSYSLTMNINGEQTVSWVDDWASEETLPQTLKDLQSHIENIIETINQ